jgi:hypothetical protein
MLTLERILGPGYPGWRLEVIAEVAGDSYRFRVTTPEGQQRTTEALQLGHIRGCPRDVVETAVAAIKPLVLDLAVAAWENIPLPTRARPLCSGAGLAGCA